MNHIVVIRFVKAFVAHFFAEKEIMASSDSSRLFHEAERRSSEPSGAVLRQSVSGLQAAATIASADILRGRGEVQILHNGDVYRLTVTRAGKLILHK